MYNRTAMVLAFEREKNMKAAAYTFVVCALLGLLFLYAPWSLPKIVQPPPMEYVEVNLGNSDQGLGDIAPQIPGEPSSSEEENYQPPKTSQPTPQEQNITGDENETDDAPVVHNNPKPVVKNENDVPSVKTKPVTHPVAQPTPAPPQPKAVYKGGKNPGPGGNNADSYNNVRNQGIAGGNGDQGQPGGNPNSNNYTGSPSGGNGVRIRTGLNGRHITHLPSFEDDFNENAKVAVNITVDKGGKVVSATVNLNGTTTANAGMKAIAVRKALQLKLNAGNDDEQSGTIVFDFRVKG